MQAGRVDAAEDAGIAGSTGGEICKSRLRTAHPSLQLFEGMIKTDIPPTEHYQPVQNSHRGPTIVCICRSEFIKYSTVVRGDQSVVDPSKILSHVARWEDISSHQSRLSFSSDVEGNLTLKSPPVSSHPSLVYPKLDWRCNMHICPSAQSDRSCSLARVQILHLSWDRFLES